MMWQASDHPFPKFSVEETESRIALRVQGELQFLDGATMAATFALNKHVRTSYVFPMLWRLHTVDLEVL